MCLVEIIDQFVDRLEAIGNDWREDEGVLRTLSFGWMKYTASSIAKGSRFFMISSTTRWTTRQLSCPLDVSFITYWWCLRTWYHAFYMKPKWFVSRADPWRELSSRFVPSDERNHSVTSHWSILSHRKQSSEISSTSDRRLTRSD